jgi:hypothetical protein
MGDWLEDFRDHCIEACEKTGSEQRDRRLFKDTFYGFQRFFDDGAAWRRRVDVQLNCADVHIYLAPFGGRELFARRDRLEVFDERSEVGAF